MPWVITSLCQDCVDMSCVDVCPVDCIVQFNKDDNKDDNKNDWVTNQLYIDPDECIDCGVCEPECPWEAIFEEDQVPKLFHDDIALNARVLEIRDQFDVPDESPTPKSPSSAEIQTNKEKWGFTED